MYFAALIARNMRRNPARTILTTLTIALATFIYTVLASVPASMDRIISDASKTLRLVVINRTAPWVDLPARYCNQIREMPGCVACVAMTGWPAYYRDPTDTVTPYAVGPEVADVFPDYQLTGEQRRLQAADRRGAVVGRVLMRKYGWKIGQQVTLHGEGADNLQLTFIIVGEIPSKRYPNSFTFRRDYFNEALRAAGRGDADIAWNLIVRVDRAEHLAALAKEIDDYFKNSDYETRTVTESDALSSDLSALGDVRAIVASLCAVVILTVLLIAGNSTAMTVRERTGEVAVMRALGFERPAIGALLFGECAAMGIGGGALGAGSAWWMFSSGVTLGPVLQGNGALWVAPWGAAQALIVAIAISIMSALPAVFAALRITPAMAFRAVV